jgi:hypothetical protein
MMLLSSEIHLPNLDPLYMHVYAQTCNCCSACSYEGRSQHTYYTILVYSTYRFRSLGQLCSTLSKSAAQSFTAINEVVLNLSENQERVLM